MRELVVAALALVCRGRCVPDADPERVWAFTVRERLASLAWLRASDAIVRTWPGIARAWRGSFGGALVESELAMTHAVDVFRVLDAAGTIPVVLKGAPLARQAHGDIASRVSADCDIYVAPDRRALAEQVLAEAGWMRYLGTTEEDATFERLEADGHPRRVEVHSTLATPRFRHLPRRPPATTIVSLGGVDVRALAPEVLPGYLAAHLASHDDAPLLWPVDLAASLDRLDERGRMAAEIDARARGFGGYLAWGRSIADAVDAAADGDIRAAETLAYAADGRRHVHPVWRHLACADGWRARAHVAGSFAYPPWVARQERTSVAVAVAGRLRRHVASLAPRAGGGEADGVAGGITRHLSAGSLVAVAQEVVAAGSEMAFALTGASMAPAILAGDRVVVDAGPAHRGDVVLAVVRGAPVVHRVIAVSPRSVVTRGDACCEADPPIDRDAVVARVVMSERHGGRRYAHVPTLRFGVAALARGTWYRARAIVGRRHRLGSVDADGRSLTEARHGQ